MNLVGFLQTSLGNECVQTPSQSTGRVPQFETYNVQFNSLAIQDIPYC